MIIGVNNIHSLVHGVVNSAWRLESVETSVNEVASIECTREAFRSWEILRWQVFFLRHFSAILLIGCLVDQVLLKSLFWVFDFVSVCREFSWDDILTLDLLIIVFDSSIHLGVKFAVLPHLLQSLMLEGSKRVFQCKITLTLLNIIN